MSELGLWRPGKAWWGVLAFSQEGPGRWKALLAFFRWWGR